MIEKLKKINIKFVVKSFTMVWGLVLIILMTITNVGLRQDFNWLAWLSSSLIIFGITVFGLLMGESSGRDKQTTKPDGLYQINKEKYEETRELVDSELNYFPQFYDYEKEQEYFRKKLDHITSQNITREQAELIVLNCQKEDIELLKTQPLKLENGKVIRKITDEEVIEVIMDVFEGRVKFEAEPVNYFLTLDGSSKNIGMLEEGTYTDKEIKTNKKTHRIVKIISSFVFSLAWGLLTVYDFISGDDTQAWVNLVSRVAALFTSFYSGYLSAVIEIKLEAKKIMNKVVVLRLFHNALLQKIFIPKLENELAMEEYEKHLLSLQPQVSKDPAVEEVEEKEEVVESTEGENQYGSTNEPRPVGAELR